MVSLLGEVQSTVATVGEHQNEVGLDFIRGKKLDWPDLKIKLIRNLQYLIPSRNIENPYFDYWTATFDREGGIAIGFSPGFWLL